MNRTLFAKSIAKGEELVVIPRKEYDKFLAAYAQFIWHTKEREAHDDIVSGRVSRAYTTKKELRAALLKLKK